MHHSTHKMTDVGYIETEKFDFGKKNDVMQKHISRGA